MNSKREACGKYILSSKTMTVKKVVGVHGTYDCNYIVLNGRESTEQLQTRERDEPTQQGPLHFSENNCATSLLLRS